MKKFKTKKNNGNKKIVLIFLSFLVFIMLFIYVCSFRLERSCEVLINYLCNNLRITNESNPKPFNYLINNLDFLISDYMFIEEDVLVKNEVLPKIYIYNTHNEEEYKENNDYNIKANVITASFMLQDALSKYKLESIVEERRVSDYLDNKSYSDSYKISRTFLEDVILKNNSLEYFIDVHRDSVKKEHTQIMIDGKEYAKIMFVLGLENENFKQNKEVITKINNYLNEFYPGLSRGIYEKSGKGVNGVYNQDFNRNTMLIEIGGVDSNLNSVFNSTEIIAKSLYYVIGEKNEKVS